MGAGRGTGREDGRFFLLWAVKTTANNSLCPFHVELET